MREIKRREREKQIKKEKSLDKRETGERDSEKTETEVHVEG